MHQMDLTEGVIWKKIDPLRRAGGALFLLQSAYSITDLIVAGWFIGKDGISAINNASQVMMILTQIIMGITTGATFSWGSILAARTGPTGSRRIGRCSVSPCLRGASVRAALSAQPSHSGGPPGAGAGGGYGLSPGVFRRSHCHLRIQCLGGHAPALWATQAALLLCGRDSGL